MLLTQQSDMQVVESYDEGQDDAAYIGPHHDCSSCFMPCQAWQPVKCKQHTSLW